MSVSLTGIGFEKTIEVPADMFFELLEIVPSMIEKIGFAECKNQYTDMWDSVDSSIWDRENLSWFNSDDETKVFLRQCQILIALAAHLFEIPLILSGDSLVEKVEDIGGVNVTEQVENGSIHIGQFL